MYVYESILQAQYALIYHLKLITNAQQEKATYGFKNRKEQLHTQYRQLEGMLCV